MNSKNKLLRLLTKNILKVNRKFKSLHEGESCYIFGNGASIKYFDLSQFDDRVSIGCGSLFLHNDFKKLNLKYYYAAHPFFFYKYWFNPYKKKYEKNKCGFLYRRNIESNPNLEYFVNLSNYFGIRGNNINYVHHFGSLSSSPPKLELDGLFSAMDGSMSAMLGIAIYMGFNKITLVGCDYTHKPRAHGHFFEFGKFQDSIENDIFCETLLKHVSEIADIETLTVDESYTGEIINHISYEKMFSSKPYFKENLEIVSEKNLLALNDVNLEYKIY